MMAVDGTYDVEVSMPAGTRRLKIIFKSEGVALTGFVDGPFGKHPFSQGTVFDEELTWMVSLRPRPYWQDRFAETGSQDGLIKKIGKFIWSSLNGPPLGMPMAARRMRPVTELKIEFRAKVIDERISGQMKFGPYGTGPFEGARIPD